MYVCVNNCYYCYYLLAKLLKCIVVLGYILTFTYSTLFGYDFDLYSSILLILSIIALNRQDGQTLAYQGLLASYAISHTV